MANNTQWEHNCPENLREVAKCLAATTNRDKLTRVQAEKKLERNVQTQQFGVRLLEVVACPKIPDVVQICSAIYFKNFIKKYWSCEVWWFFLFFLYNMFVQG